LPLEALIRCKNLLSLQESKRFFLLRIEGFFQTLVNRALMKAILTGALSGATLQRLANSSPPKENMTADKILKSLELESEIEI
jgi:hypothetical protein